MKNDNYLAIGWAFLSGIIAVEVFFTGRVLSKITMVLWIMMLCYSAYVRWKVAKWLSVFYLLLALVLVIGICLSFSKFRF